MATASFNLDNSALTWGWIWRNHWAANQIARTSQVAAGYTGTCDFSFTGTDLQITAQTSGTAPTLQYNIDGGGLTTLSTVTAGSYALAAVGGTIADTLHTCQIRVTGANGFNFWWQFTNGITVTGAAPAISLESGFGPTYVVGDMDGSNGILTEGLWAPNTAIIQILQASLGWNNQIRFRGNPTGLKLFMYQGGGRIHTFQDGVDLGFVTVSSATGYDWVDIRPNAVNFDGASHLYEIKYVCTTQAMYVYQMMVIGGTVDTSNPPTWRKGLIFVADSKTNYTQKLCRGKLADTITCTNGNATITGGAASGFTTLTSSGIALGNSQYINLNNNPQGPLYQLAASGSVIDGTHLKLAAVFPDATQTSVPGYFSDLTVTQDSGQCFSRILCDALGYAEYNLSVSGQVCLDKTTPSASTVGTENLQPLSLASLRNLNFVGGVVVEVGHNDAFNNAKAITNVTNNGGLFRITSTNHGFSTNDIVQITDVAGTGGLTAVNATWTITNINANTYDCQSSTFAGTYTSGGIGHKPTLDQFQTSYQNLLGKLTRAYPGVAIYCMGVIPSGVVAEAIRARYSAAISAAVTAVGGLTQYVSMTSVTGTGAIDIASDNIHPAESGHSKVAAALQAVIPAATSLTGGGGRRRIGVML